MNHSDSQTAFGSKSSLLGPRIRSQGHIRRPAGSDGSVSALRSYMSDFLQWMALEFGGPESREPLDQYLPFSHAFHDMPAGLGWTLQMSPAGPPLTASRIQSVSSSPLLVSQFARQEMPSQNWSLTDTCADFARRLFHHLMTMTSSLCHGLRQLSVATCAPSGGMWDILFPMSQNLVYVFHAPNSAANSGPPMTLGLLR